MCETCIRVHHEAGLLLAEQHMLANDTGFTGATRRLTDAERRAKVKFGAIDRLEQTAVEAARAALASVWEAARRAIQSAAGGDAQGALTAERLAATAASFAQGQPAEVAQAATRAATLIRSALAATYQTAAEQAAAEAEAQGVPAARVAPAVPDEPDAGNRVFVLAAIAAAMVPWDRLTTVYRQRFTGAKAITGATVGDLRAALEAVPVDGALDEARQAVHQAIGAGRADAANTIGPSAIWASELLDGNTCSACAVMDGQEYATVEDARVDYPLGGYKGCKGGARCRGTLVFEYDPASDDVPPPPPSVLDDLPPAPKPSGPRNPAAPPRSLDPAEMAAPSGSIPSGKPPVAPKRRKGKGQLYTDWRQIDVDPALRAASPEDLARAINPRHTGGSKVYSNNCTSCVTAYEARARGFDVEAGRAPGGQGRYESVWTGFFRTPDGATPELPRYASRADVESMMNAGPEDARYIVQVSWKTGGSHVFSAERRNGTIHYVEPQVPTAPDASGHWAKARIGEIRGRGQIGVLRVDNLDLTESGLEAVEKSPVNWMDELSKTDAKPYSVTTYTRTATGRVYNVPHFRATPSGYERVPEAERARIKRDLEAAAAESRRVSAETTATKKLPPDYREVTGRLRELEQEVARWRIR